MAALPEIPEIDAIFVFLNTYTIQYLSVIVFDLCHLFCKKVRLQGFIKKCIIPEPSEINNLFLLY
jgi:hypothetical protein